MQLQGSQGLFLLVHQAAHRLALVLSLFSGCCQEQAVGVLRACDQFDLCLTAGMHCNCIKAGGSAFAL